MPSGLPKIRQARAVGKFEDNYVKTINLSDAKNRKLQVYLYHCACGVFLCVSSSARQLLAVPPNQGGCENAKRATH